MAIREQTLLNQPCHMRKRTSAFTLKMNIITCKYPTILPLLSVN